MRLPRGERRLLLSLLLEGVGFLGVCTGSASLGLSLVCDATVLTRFILLLNC